MAEPDDVVTELPRTVQFGWTQLVQQVDPFPAPVPVYEFQGRKFYCSDDSMTPSEIP